MTGWKSAVTSSDEFRAVHGIDDGLVHASAVWGPGWPRASPLLYLSISLMA